MFQDHYKNAYNKLHPERDIVFTKARIEKYMKGNVTQARHQGKKTWGVWRPVAVTALALCLVFVLGLPVVAQNVPRVYDVLEEHAPGFLDYLVPVQKSDSSQGIVFRVEAINISGNTAEAVVSFADEGEGDYIHGMVDMYDSYHLKSLSTESNIGGCSFLEYDPVEDKAYFKVDLISTTGTFDASRLEFNVTKLLTDCRCELKEIPLSNILRTSDVKTVTVNGRGGTGLQNPALKKLITSKDGMDPRPGQAVLDIPLNKYSPETMEITAMAYMDGILRIQLLRGNLKDVDRHMNIYMRSEAGETISPDMSVAWQEELAGETVSMEEFYFVITKEQLETYTLWGESDVRTGCVKGKWSITFDLQ